MKKFLIILIILGTWAVLDPGAVVNADEDLMTAAGVVKFKDRISAPLFTIEDLAGGSQDLLHHGRARGGRAPRRGAVPGTERHSPAPRGLTEHR